MSRGTPYTVKELIETLQGMAPEATVEFECPKRLAADRGSIEGSRVFVTDVQEVWYNSPDNKWVLLT